MKEHHYWTLFGLIWIDIGYSTDFQFMKFMAVFFAACAVYCSIRALRHD